MIRENQEARSWFCRYWYDIHTKSCENLTVISIIIKGENTPIWHQKSASANRKQFSTVECNPSEQDSAVLTLSNSLQDCSMSTLPHSHGYWRGGMENLCRNVESTFVETRRVRLDWTQRRVRLDWTQLDSTGLFYWVLVHLDGNTCRHWDVKLPGPQEVLVPMF